MLDCIARCLFHVIAESALHWLQIPIQQASNKVKDEKMEDGRWKMNLISRTREDSVSGHWTYMPCTCWRIYEENKYHSLSNKENHGVFIGDLIAHVSFL